MITHVYSVLIVLSHFSKRKEMEMVKINSEKKVLLPLSIRNAKSDSFQIQILPFFFKAVILSIKDGNFSLLVVVNIT